MSNHTAVEEVLKMVDDHYRSQGVVLDEGTLKACAIVCIDRFIRQFPEQVQDELLEARLQLSRPDGLAA